MIDLRKETSVIIGARIEEGHWDETFKHLDKVGKFNQRVILELILLILKKLDETRTV